jgi:hypothetical protein
MWGALSDDRTVLLFTIAAGPRQQSQSPSQSYSATDGRSISKSWCPAPPGAHDQIFITLVFLGRRL